MSDRHSVTPQVLELAGQRWVVLPEDEYQRLANADSDGLPPLPLPDSRGYYPALEYSRASFARKIIRSRRAAGLTQVELARRAHVRPETLNRLERGTVMPSAATVAKIVRALEAAGA